MAANNPNTHHYNYPLMQAFREFGVENFNFEIIDKADSREELIDKEHYWIVQKDCVTPNGYNQTALTGSGVAKDDEVALKIRQTKRKLYGKTVCEIQNGQIIRQWNSLVEAAEETGLDRYKISAVCNGKRHTTGGKIFRFIQNGEIIEPIYDSQTKSNRITSSCKKIAQIDIVTHKILNIYDSIALAEKATHCNASSISNCCKKGNYKTVGGYIWKYVEDIGDEENEH